jgi:hypothetical protein
VHEGGIGGLKLGHRDLRLPVSRGKRNAV